MKELQQTFPEASVELWATDQHRVGLKPILRRVWVRKGSRATVSVQHRFQWLYIYSGCRIQLQAKRSGSSCQP